MDTKFIKIILVFLNQKLICTYLHMYIYAVALLLKNIFFFTEIAMQTKSLCRFILKMLVMQLEVVNSLKNHKIVELHRILSSWVEKLKSLEI